jgi:hypothetical protein
MIPSRFESCTESSTISIVSITRRSSLSKHSAKQSGAGKRRRSIGVVTSCASSPPLMAHAEQGLCPLKSSSGLHQASCEYRRVSRHIRDSVWRHSAAALPAIPTADNDRVYLSAALVKDVIIRQAIVIHSGMLRALGVQVDRFWGVSRESTQVPII